MIEKNVKFE